jgi:hypothetical protein
MVMVSSLVLLYPQASAHCVCVRTISTPGDEQQLFARFVQAGDNKIKQDIIRASFIFFYFLTIDF